MIQFKKIPGCDNIINIRPFPGEGSGSYRSYRKQDKNNGVRQSILLPLDTDIACASDNDLTVQIEMLHLG